MENESITNAKVLIIDDDVNMMDILSVILSKYGHSVSSFTEPVAAIEDLKSQKYDILIVNYLMTPVTGDRIIELVRDFDKEIYIILMSTHKDLTPSIETMQNLAIQAYFEKSSHFEQLVMLIQSGIKYIEQLRNIKNMNMKLENYLVDFGKILLNTVSVKDHFTEEHSQRVANIATFFAAKLGLSNKDIKDIKTAACFHDIGKIGVPDSILLKDGKLTPEEYDTIKLHPVIGANIFSSTDIFKGVSPIIYSHHERIDGTGYPDGKKGSEIPYNAKILAICDSFDAIVSRRPYKEETSIEFALDEIEKGKGTQFDDGLANKFIDIVSKNIELIKEFLNSKIT